MTYAHGGGTSNADISDKKEDILKHVTKFKCT